MRSTAESTEDNKIKLTIDIREDELVPFVDQTVKKLSREVRIPGFRPGKAPRQVVEARIGTKVLRQEAIEGALESYYRQALLDNGIDAIAPPQVDIKEGDEDGDVSVDAIIETRPVVTVEGYGALEIEVPAATVDDDDVAESLHTLQEQFGSLIEVDREVQSGDQVTLDIIALEGETTESLATDLSVRLGKGQVEEEIEIAVLGHKAGDTVEVSLGDQEDPPSRRVVVKAVKEIKLPDLDDEFAAEVSEFETLDELKGDIRAQLTSMRSSLARNMYRQETIEKLVETVEPKEVPDALLSRQVEDELHQFGHQLEGQGLTLQRYLELTNQSEPQLLSSVYANARRSVLFDLALRAVAVAEAIEVTDEDIDKRIEEFAERSSGDGEKVLEHYKAPDRRLDVRVDLLKSRAFNRILSLVVIKDNKGNLLNLRDIDPEAAQEIGLAEEQSD